MKKKIVHVITGLNNGGAEGVLTRLCLNGQDFEHVVISLTDLGKYGPQLLEAGIKVHGLKMSPGRPSFRKLFELSKLIKNENPFLVQTWMYHADLFGGVAAKLSGVERVFWGIRHSTLDKNNSKLLTRIIARVCAVLSYILPERIICCAEKAKDVHARIGYQKSKLVVIPNGYDLRKFSPDSESRERLRSEFNVPVAMPLLGMVGRFAEQKDHKNLIDALSLIHSALDFRCILVGDNLNGQNSQVCEWVAHAGLAGKVLLAGPRTDIPEIMNALDIHVLSSNGGEGFPNVVAEAMACGTPCVSTDVGDAKAIIGNTGTTCPVSDCQALSRSIKKLPMSW